MLNTSLTCTPRAMHLVRSMSRYSQGVLAPGAVEQALQARRLVAGGDDLVADALQFAEAEVAAVLDDELEAAGGAQPVDGRRAEGRDDGPCISRWQRSRIVSAMASAVRPGRRRSENSLSMTYIEPRLGALAPRISDWPEMPTVCATPVGVADDRFDAGP